MKKALSNTKVTVKLRKSVHHDNEWYLFIESYPVYKKGDNKPSRVVESVNRTISTPQWDMSSIARVLPDGSFNYKPKRDVNGIIQCKSRIDQEACIYADNVRKLRQHEYDNAALYSDREEEIIEQNERSAQDFRRKINTFQERNGETIGGHQDVSASRSFGRKQERDGVTQYRLYLFRHRQGRSEASFH